MATTPEMQVQPRPIGGLDPASPAATTPPATPLDDPAFREMLAHSPTLRTQIEQLQRAGGTVRWGTAGAGTFIENDKDIVIDRNAMGNGPQLAQSMAHELGHYTFNEPQDRSTREGYVRGLLRDEAGATLNNARVRAEIQGATDPQVDIGFPGLHAADYQRISESRLRGDITEEEALGQIAETFKTEVTSTNGQTYEQYYGQSYPGPDRARANVPQQSDDNAAQQQGTTTSSVSASAADRVQGAGLRQVDVSSATGTNVGERLQNAVLALGLAGVTTADAARRLSDSLQLDTMRNGGRPEDIKSLVANPDQSTLFGIKADHQNFRIDVQQSLARDAGTERDALQRTQEASRQSQLDNPVREQSPLAR